MAFFLHSNSLCLRTQIKANSHKIQKKLTILLTIYVDNHIIQIQKNTVCNGCRRKNAVFAMHMGEYVLSALSSGIFNSGYKKERGVCMRYCPNCGAEVNENAVVCVRCGSGVYATPAPAPVPAEPQKDSTLQTVIKVFMIIGCVMQGVMLLPLAWCIPLTVHVFKAFKENKPISTGKKIFILLFVNLVAGICLLCMNED